MSNIQGLSQQASQSVSNPLSDAPYIKRLKKDKSQSFNQIEGVITSLNQQLQQQEYNDFVVMIDGNEISSEFSEQVPALQKSDWSEPVRSMKDFDIQISEFDVKEYVRKNNIDKNLVHCHEFQSEYNSLAQEYDEPKQSSLQSDSSSSESSITSSSSSQSSSSSSSQKKKKISSSSQSCKIVPLINLTEANQKKRKGSLEIKNIRVRQQEQRRKQHKPKKEIVEKKKDKTDKRVEFLKKQKTLETKKQVKDKEKSSKIQEKKLTAKINFPTSVIDNAIKKQKEIQAKDKVNQEEEKKQMQRQIITEMQKLAKSKKTGKKQRKIKKRQQKQLELKDYIKQKQLQANKKQERLIKTLNSFQRCAQLQQILKSHQHSHDRNQKNQLLSCLLMDNYYFQIPFQPLPNSPKIPQKFPSPQTHQKIFCSNIRAQLYHQIKEKILNLAKSQQNDPSPDSSSQKNIGITQLFTIRIEKQEKVQKDGLCQILAVVEGVDGGYKIDRILGDLMQNFRSRYRVFMFVDRHRMNVLCTIKDIERKKDQKRSQQQDSVYMKLIAAVNLFQVQKDQKNEYSHDNLDPIFIPFEATFYDLEKITTTVRQYEAVLNLKYSPLAAEIVDPTHIPQAAFQEFSPSLAELHDVLKLNYNPSQMKAIVEISRSSKGIQLLQGPPGTGKTSTLLGLLSCEYAKLLFYNEQLMKLRKKQKDNSFKPNKPEQESNCLKILICAPSNSAVDLIRLKIIQNGLQAVKDASDQKWSGLSRYPTYFPKQTSPKTPKSSTKPQPPNSPHLHLHRLHPQILRIGLSPTQQAESPQTCNFDLHQIINTIFYNEIKTNKRQLSKDQLNQKISVLGEEIKGILDDVGSIVQRDLYGFGEDFVVNQKLNFVDVKKKALEALKKVIASSGKVLRKNQNLCTTYYLRDLTKYLQTTLITQSQILLTTLSTSYSQKILSSNPTFTCVIVDQAAQATQPSVLIPLQYGIRKVILIGDQCQLPPTVKNVDLGRNFYNRSLFQRLWEVRGMMGSGGDRKDRQGNQLRDVPGYHRLYMLNTQYRMSQKLRQFPSLYFYNKKLQDAQSIKQRKPKHILSNIKQVNFIDCVLGKQEKSRESYLNRFEGQCVVAILLYFIKMCLQAGGDDCLSIGVITPYSQQQKFIQNIFTNKKNQLPKPPTPKITPQSPSPPLSPSTTKKTSPEPSVTISTVDSYQGQQRDIIIISTVRSNAGGNVGFLQDQRRINVALTRAKYVVIVVGNSGTLQSSKIWNSYIEWVKNNANYINHQQKNPSNFTNLLNTLFQHPKKTDYILEQQSES